MARLLKSASCTVILATFHVSASAFLPAVPAAHKYTAIPLRSSIQKPTQLQKKQSRLFEASSSPSESANKESASQASLDADNVAASAKNPEDIIPDAERRANLFQFLLRDLQIEGVPLLSVDADHVDTFQAAMWTTMAELLTGWKTHKGKQKEKACLILEDIPIEALRAFVSDFQILQTQQRLMAQLPELEMFHLAMVGKGVGPAITVTIEPLSATTATTKDQGGEINRTGAAGETSQHHHHLNNDFFDTITDPAQLDERKLTAAMKMFVDRVACGLEVCPHFNFDMEVQASQTNYRTCGFTDVCHVLSSLWNAICEIQSTPADQLSAVMLLLPTITEMKTTRNADGMYVTGPEQQHARFAAVAELMGRSLCLYRGNNVFDLFFFHPFYERDLIFPKDRPAFGHLPPSSWLRPIVQEYYKQKVGGGVDKGAKQRVLSDNDLQLANYQRRAPVTAVCIKRVAMMEEQAAKDPHASTMVELDVGGGEMVTASSVPYYARNILRLVEEGKESLQSELEEEMKIASSSSSG